MKTTECRVGVVGLYNAGKTVFLTSLVNHLQDHDPDRFALGKPGTRVRKFVAVPPDDGWSAFNYPGFRDALVHAGRWPEKTRDRAVYACRFERSDWTFSDGLLKLYDLPGERIADAAMVGCDFAGWSDYLLGVIANDSGYRTCCGPFLDEIARAKPAEGDLTRAYKHALASLILSFKPLVSPSTFLLDVAGKLARGQTPDEVTTDRFSGLGAADEFAPLPTVLRDTPLGQAFADRYERYVTAVARPAVAALKSCNALVVLIDVTMTLAGGVGMYNDTRQIVRDLFGVLNPGEHPVFGPIGRGLAKVLLPHQWRPGGITRVAFAAPKMDLVHPLDRDRMLLLLRRMVEKEAADRDGLKHRFFNLASVVSTKVLQDAKGQRVLVGVPLRGADGRKIPPGPEQRFTVSALPDDWPLAWDAGAYTFPEVYPRMPARQDYPPDQVNVDKLASFVID